MKASAVILAGGRSSRMGTNKALLEVNGKALIAIQVEELSRQFSEVIIVSNQPWLYANLKATVITDQYPGLGPLAGIHAGLKAAANEVIFLVPCDMPFISAAVGTQLLSRLGGADGLILERDGKLEPLYGLYTKRCLPVIEEFLRAKRLKVIDFYPRLNIQTLPAASLHLTCAVETALFNINTPQDFQQAKALSGRLV